jgi:hypothetical protein
MFGWPVFAAVMQACVTWAAAMPLALLGFSQLVAGPFGRLVDPAVVVLAARVADDAGGARELSPQLEVSVALLVTMTCFRGMAARLRMGGDDD